MNKRSDTATFPTSVSTFWWWISKWPWIGNWRKEEIIKLFLVNNPILCSLKTPGNLWFSSVFKGKKWEH